MLMTAAASIAIHLLRDEPDPKFQIIYKLNFPNDKFSNFYRFLSENNQTNILVDEIQSATSTDIKISNKDGTIISMSEKKTDSSQIIFNALMPHIESFINEKQFFSNKIKEDLSKTEVLFSKLGLKSNIPTAEKKLIAANFLYLETKYISEENIDKPSIIDLIKSGEIDEKYLHPLVFNQLISSYKEDINNSSTQIDAKLHNIENYYPSMINFLNKALIKKDITSDQYSEYLSNIISLKNYEKNSHLYENNIIDKNFIPQIKIEMTSISNLAPKHDLTKYLVKVLAYILASAFLGASIGMAVSIIRKTLKQKSKFKEENCT